MRATTLGRAAAFLVAVGVVACSDEPSKSDIAKAIDAKLGQESCFALADMGKPVSWPLRFSEGGLLGGGPDALPPFLRDMERAGYVRVEHRLEQRGLLLQNVAVVTPIPQAAGWWDPHRGWCVGKRTVAEVQQWTLPAKGSGQRMWVKFTWRLADVPAWARRREFDNIPGLKEPVPGEAELTRTNNGWVAE